MYLNGGKNGNSAFRRAESTIFTAVQTVNRRCVSPGEEDGSASTARNAEPILSKKLTKQGINLLHRPAALQPVFFCPFSVVFLVYNDPDLLNFTKLYHTLLSAIVKLLYTPQCKNKKTTKKNINTAKQYKHKAVQKWRKR
mgnify:CR=1 FL=1